MDVVHSRRISALAAAATFSALAVVTAPSTADAQNQNCPTINGKFRLQTEADGRLRSFLVVMRTKQDGGQFSYTVNLAGRFDPADGKFRPLRIGDRDAHSRVYCAPPNAVIFEVKADDTGHVTTSKITPVSESAIYVESYDPIRSGAYIRTNEQ